jgi:hypothetical protein
MTKEQKLKYAMSAFERIEDEFNGIDHEDLTSSEKRVKFIAAAALEDLK